MYGGNITSVSYNGLSGSYAGDSSTAWQARPVVSAAMMVVLEPLNGS